MGVPKSRVSHSRGRMRQSHQALRRQQLSKCGQCQLAIRPHTICLKCGFYKGKLVMQAREEEAP